MKKSITLNVTEKSQFAVFGLGKFGTSVVTELVSYDRNVFCCDTDRRRVQELAGCVEHVVQADATDDEFLESIGIGNFDVVVISFSKNFEDAVLTVMKLKERGVKTVITKAADERHKRVLEKVGADYVILPEVVMGERLAHVLVYNDPLTYIHESDRFDIEQMPAKEEWEGKTLSGLDLRKVEGINILGIIRNEELIENISPETRIATDDILIVIRTVGK